MDTLTVVLLAVVVALAFKDRLGAWLGKLRYRLQSGSAKQLAEYHFNRLMAQLSQFGSEYKLQAGELNHIKGQLQETMHKLQAGMTAGTDDTNKIIHAVYAARVETQKDVRAAEERVAIMQKLVEEHHEKVLKNLDLPPVGISDINNGLAEVKALLEKISGPEAAAQADLYTRALGDLAKGQTAIIDTLEQLKTNQVQMVAVLNKLTIS